MSHFTPNRPETALALLGAALVTLSSFLPPSSPEALHITAQLVGISVIVWSIQAALARSSNEVEERIDWLANTVKKAMEPQEERLAGITRAYSTNIEALDDFFAHLERSSNRRAALMQLSPYLILTRNRRELMTVLDRGTELRVMMLDPESPFVDLLTSGFGNEHVRDELHTSIENCRVLSVRYPNFHLRLYREPQPFNILLVDEVAMLTPRLPLHTHRGLTLRVERGPVLSNLEDVFETAWMTAVGKTTLHQAVL